MTREIQRWESEGGALSGRNRAGLAPLRGTPSQVEWAYRIRRAVDVEFDRVATALASAAGNQSPANRRYNDAILAILETKRTEVMANDSAGYFIHEWQEMGGRVRQLILQDARYAALRAKRAER